MSADDLALVQQAVAGNAAALKLLLLGARDRLTRSVAAKIPKELRAVFGGEDIVQEAFVEVFRRIEKFEPRGPDSFNRWLSVIALNQLRNAIRHHRTAKRGGACACGCVDRCVGDSSLDLLDMLAGPGRTPSRCVAREEAVRAVRAAIDSLPEHHRKAVWLVHIEGKAIRDVAQLMGRTDHAVRGLCSRGLNTLRDLLESDTKLLSSLG